MLKGVKKGIKKKIKGKKDKKEDDLFDPEQLEKYKRELEEAKKARQQDESGCSSGAAGGGAEGHEDDEEWLRFKQLTSGVDVLVNKVSTDLEKIKESSFFQRNKPSEQNKLFASERPAGAIIPSPEREAAAAELAEKAEENPGEGDEENKVPGENEPAGEDVVDGIVPVLESPEIPEIDDSLFDTTFVDAIATGDIKLAYIPDSPTEEEGEDPFDTSGVADVVKRIEEAEKIAKRQVNLGDTVDFLTGKVDKTAIARPRVKAAEMKAKARPRPHAINLLGDFEDGAAPCAPPVAKPGQEVEKPKDLFDQILDTPTKDAASPLLEKIDLLAAVKESSKRDTVGNKDSSPSKDPGIKDVISEFDVISGAVESEPLPSVTSSIPSALAALLTTTTTNPEPEEDELDDEFAALAAESIQKYQPPPGEEEVKQEDGEDPFDTSFVEKSAPHGKCELQILENEILGDVKGGNAGGDDDDDFDFDPRAGEDPPQTLQIQNAPKANPLEDLSPVAAKAPTIQPQVKIVDPFIVESEGGREVNESHLVLDPFDTSKLETVLPGKAELKLLEEELLSSVEQAKVQPPQLPEKIVSAIKTKQTQEDEFDFDPRKDEVKHHVLDLHDSSHHAFDEVSKVMTPQQEREIELDPFDTSAVAASGLIPGALELKLLEDELVTPTNNAAPVVPVMSTTAKMPRTYPDDDDFDFDPRGGVPAPAPPPPKTTEDIFDSTMDFAVDKPLSPQLEMAPQAAPEPMLCPNNSDDPFDTSGIQIENYLAKSELKQVEEELLNAPAQPQPARALPVIVGVEFKKSHVMTTVPQQQPPRPEHPPVPHLLEGATPIEDSFKPLAPLEVPNTVSGVISVFDPSPMADPFDTSVAEGVLPGKTEIKLLEQELGVGAGMPRRLSDPDFDPREPSHPSNQLVSKPLTPVPMQPQQLTPQKVANNLQETMEPEDIDPFDTSAAETVMPGKAELKALEAELL